MDANMKGTGGVTNSNRMLKERDNTGMVGFAYILLLLYHRNWNIEKEKSTNIVKVLNNIVQQQ